MPKTTDVQPNRESNPAPALREPSGVRADYRAADIRGASMAGQNFEYADFRASDLRGVNFSHSNLRYADFRGSDVSGANFQNASLYEAKMQGVVAFETDFRKADLRLANFGGAYHLDSAMMPERRSSPGEIASDAETQPAKAWKNQEVDRRTEGQQDGSADNGRQDQQRADNHLEKGRGRGR